MIFSNVKTVVIPEGKVKAINRTSDGLLLWKGGYKNWVPFSTESDGKTIYNGGLGYKNGYRVRSGGAETAHNNAACTGFIPVKGGDVVRISGWTRYTDSGNAANAINAANSSFTNIGQVSNGNYGIFASGGGYAAYDKSTIEDGANGISKWVVPPSASGVAYIRVSAYNPYDGAPGEKLIVTINEEIT